MNPCKHALLITATALLCGCASTGSEALKTYVAEVGDGLSAAIEKLPDVETVAVTAARGDDPNLSEWFARELESELTAGRSFVVVERANLDEILAEHRLVLSDVFDEETRPEVGRLVGADALVISEIQPSPDRSIYSLRGRVIDLASGRILFSMTASLNADDLISGSREDEDGGGGGFFAFVGNVFLGILKVPATPVTAFFDIFETVSVEERGLGYRLNQGYPVRVIQGIWDGLPIPFCWVSGIFDNNLNLTSSMWDSWL